MPASVETAMNKLHGCLQAIYFREGVKPHEGKRIEEAFILLSVSEGCVESKTQKRREGYRELLKNLHKAVGRQAVVLCAVGLGQSAVANMKESLKIELVAAVKAQKEALSCAILEKLVEEYSVKGRCIAILLFLNPNVVAVSLSKNGHQSGFYQQIQWTEGESRLLSKLQARAEDQIMRLLSLLETGYSLLEKLDTSLNTRIRPGLDQRYSQNTPELAGCS